MKIWFSNMLQHFRPLILATTIFQLLNVSNGLAGFSNYFLCIVSCRSEISSIIWNSWVSELNFWWIRKKDQLKELIVDSNQLTDECDYPYLQSLMHLSISNNQICDLERLMDKDSLLKYLIESIFWNIKNWRIWQPWQTNSSYKLAFLDFSIWISMEIQFVLCL